jgi:putative spermidine/putrescine transport system permease protein
MAPNEQARSVNSVTIPDAGESHHVAGRRRRVSSGNLGSWLARAVSWVVLALLVMPLVILVGASFSSVDYVTFPPEGFSLKWYRQFFDDPVFVDGLVLSGQIAVLASFFATILGFPAAYVLIRNDFPGRQAAWNLFLSPLLVPQIILGVALLSFFTIIGLANTFVGLLIAHTIAVMPFVIRTVGASLVTIDPRVEEAAADLGASRIEVLALITAPMVKGGLIAGALLAFIMSWVDVEVAIFLSVTGGYTLPVVMYNFMEYSITPVVVAAAAIAIYVAILLVLLVDRVVGVNNAARI